MRQWRLGGRWPRPHASVPRVTSSEQNRIAAGASSRPAASTLATGRLRLLVAGSSATPAMARWGAEVVSALADRGHALLLAAPGDAQLLAQVEPGAARHLELGIDRPLSPRALFRLRRAIADHAPQALLALDPTAARALHSASRLLGSSRVLLEVMPRTSLAPCPSVSQRMTRGTRVARTLRLGVRPLPAGVVPDRIALRRRLRLPRHGALVLTVGDFVPGSGHVTLLEALGELARRRERESSAIPLPTLVLIGSGSEEHELRALVQQLGLRERVLWLGFVSDLGTYIQAADLLVLPAAGAGLPWPVLDAFACGVPVVAGESPAMRDLIAPDRTGVLFPPGDAANLAAALDGLLLDPQLAGGLGAAGRRHLEATRSHALLACEAEALLYAQLLRQAGWATTSAGRRALLVDRDGTVIVNEPYNADPLRVRLEPEVGSALLAVRDAGAAVVVVSNQSAVARGLCSQADVEATNDRVRELLGREGAGLDAIYYCPHHPEFDPPCSCRKPEPGLLVQAASDLGLDLAGSFTVGDAERDWEAGRRAGTRVLGYRGLSAEPAAGDDASLETVLKTVTYKNWLELIRDLLAGQWQELEAERR
jgi:D-glycero-D-manno-heptose 1,7-bisphosphate phosphatase